MHLKFLVDLLYVKADSVDADAEVGCRGFVAVALDQQSEKAQFMRRQLLLGLIRRADLAEQFHDTTSDFRRHWSPTLKGLSQAFEQSGRRRFLQQVAGRSRAQRLENPVVIIIDSQHEQGHIGELFLEQLLHMLGAEILGACFVIDLPELGGSKKLTDLGVPVRTLVSFEGH